jgi:tetrahydromethanopterin S-methyltransferase subunit G
MSEAFPDASTHDVYAGADSTAGRTESRSIGELMGNVTRDLSELMRQEVTLAKAEAKQSATRAGKGIGMFVGAGIGGFLVLLFLSISLWWAIGNALGRGWAALIVAVIWAIIAAVLVSLGKKEMERVRGIPETTDSLGKIPNALKGNEEENHV